MDGDSDLSYTKRLINQRLAPLGIEVNITLRSNGNVSLSANKVFRNNTVRHAVIDSIGLIEAVWKLIKYIEQNIDDWIETELY